MLDSVVLTTNQHCSRPHLTKVDGREIEIQTHHHESVNQYRENSSSTTLVREFHLVDVKHVEQLIVSREIEKFKPLRIALEMNSDVISGVYEGGLKVWECTNDLLEYLEKSCTQFDGLNVLDLGSGSGLLGMFALKKRASSVHFQDYNAEVLELVTIPNVMLNEHLNVMGTAKFFAGDWGSLSQILGSYDVILTSETIYNPENYLKLLEVFEKNLQKNGVIFIAAKYHYFGVGGDLTQFENLLQRNGRWTTSTCFCSNEGRLENKGYLGCAMGKARQAAKTEMEKLKLKDMSCLELLKEAAKIIYIVHDEVKDKHFEMELSWVGAVTEGRHQKVPQDVFTEVERYAKSALEEDSDSGNDDM
uniref:protein-histidine N-methyltransferase n=1 Tax=Megafenestra aurita TaxID=2291010 RepID=A0A4Y7NHK1_9CRUS|nr:EOG090X0C09 [Megafenestra aurita]